MAVEGNVAGAFGREPDLDANQISMRPLSK
jgi:hypothetical protein